MDLPFEHDELELLEACAQALTDLGPVIARAARSSGMAEARTAARSTGEAWVRQSLGDAAFGIGQTERARAAEALLRLDRAGTIGQNDLPAGGPAETEYVFRTAADQTQTDVEAVSRAVERDARRFEK